MQEQGITNPALGSLGNQTGESFFSKALPAGIGLAFIIGTIIFFAMLIMGAISWISSGGDKQKLETARGTITSAIVGIVILFASYAVIRLIENFFGIHILTLDITSLVIQ